MGSTVVAAMRRMRLAAGLSFVSMVAILMTTGFIPLVLVPFTANILYRRYVLRKYWVRGRLQKEFLELRDVSEGFRARVDSILSAHSASAK